MRMNKITNFIHLCLHFMLIEIQTGPLIKTRTNYIKNLIKSLIIIKLKINPILSINLTNESPSFVLVLTLSLC